MLVCSMGKIGQIHYFGDEKIPKKKEKTREKIRYMALDRQGVWNDEQKKLSQDSWETEEKGGDLFSCFFLVFVLFGSGCMGKSKQKKNVPSMSATYIFGGEVLRGKNERTVL